MTIIIDFVKRERKKGTFQNVPNGKVETHTLYLPPAMDDNNIFMGMYPFTSRSTVRSHP